MPFLDDVLGTRYGELPGSEDCQNLSITMPGRHLSPDAKLPVMVWIHGGSYTTGSGDLAIFDPAVLVAENRVVVVSVTYRLGLFGFLATHSGRPGEPGPAGPAGGFPLGAAEHRGVRRRPGPGHRVRPVRRAATPSRT